MKRVLVLAPNHQAFRLFISNNNLNPVFFGYVNSPDTLRGYQGVVLTIERWWKNPNYTSEFFDYLQINEQSNRISIIKSTYTTF